MPFKTLPSSPSLDHLKHQARDLKAALRSHELQAFQRVREFHPRFRKATDEQIDAANLALSDAQLTIAREYCCPSWAKLKAAVLAGGSGDSSRSFHERIADEVFRIAVYYLEAGDEAELGVLIQSHPEVVRQRVFFSLSDYFGQPTLLEFVAENPRRFGRLPANIVDIARLILGSGASQDLGAMNRTLGLVSSGNVARECGAQVPLIDLLCDFGGDPNSATNAALAHGEFEAVAALIRRGAILDLPATAALGLTDDAIRLLPAANDESRHQSLAYASQFGRTEIVRLLLDAGVDPNRFNPIGGHSHSTPLHQAALAGHLETVKLLVDRGADTNIRDILFNGTPLGWAQHSGQAAVAEYLVPRTAA